MSTITTRSGKGSPLTNNEIDDNFTNLNTDKYQSGDTPTFAGLTTTADISFGDGDKAIFGAGSDLQIYHDGSDSVIGDQGTGNLYIQSNGAQILIQPVAGEQGLVVNANGGVGLYYDNSAKLATTTTGIDVTGTAEMDTLSIGGTAVTATAAELNYNDITTLGQVQASKTVTADASGYVNFDDGQQIRMGASNDLQIYHDGTNSYVLDNGTGNLMLRGTNLQLRGTATNELFADCTENGAVTLYYDNASKLATASGGVTVTGTVTCDGMSMGDSEKAQFGASNDLEIYHDGSASYIDEVGTGNLILRGSAGVLIQRYDSTENMLTAYQDDAVTLFYNGASKLATASGGVAVTGDLTATGDVIAYYSDDRLKNNLGKIENALEKVESLEGFYYEANEKAQELGYEVKREVGISAQSVEKVMPEVVAPAPIDEQYLTVKYERLVPLLIESIKELSAEVKKLKGE